MVKDKVAVVTGGASGIGKSIVDKLIKAGNKVVVGDLNIDEIQETDDLVAVKTDVSSEEDVKGLIDTSVEKFGRLDIAFNVAGMSKAGLIIDQSLEDWRVTQKVALDGVFLSTKYEALAMKETGGGAIVNVSSLNAHVPMFYGASYASAKAGVEMFTKNAALEFRDHKIRVNAILPGLVDTPLTASYFENDDLEADFKEKIVQGRPGQAEEIADPAIFLASDAASYINGTSLVVDGGWEITGYPDLSKYIN